MQQKIENVCTHVVPLPYTSLQLATTTGTLHFGAVLQVTHDVPTEQNDAVIYKPFYTSIKSTLTAQIGNVTNGCMLYCHTVTSTFSWLDGVLRSQFSVTLKFNYSRVHLFWKIIVVVRFVLLSVEVRSGWGYNEFQGFRWRCHSCPLGSVMLQPSGSLLSTSATRRGQSVQWKWTSLHFAAFPKCKVLGYFCCCCWQWLLHSALKVRF